MQKYYKYILILASFLCISHGYSEELRFKYAKGDSYRILSTVKQNVIVNGKYNHSAEIVNRISVEIKDVDEDGWGEHQARFMTSETAIKGLNEKEFTWGQEYESLFWISPLGEYSVSDEYYMPTTRNVPLFPTRNLNPNEGWEGEGLEVHDLREVFGIEKPYIIPFKARYIYKGEIEIDGKKLQEIAVFYTLDYANPVPKKEEFSKNDQIIDFPFHTSGNFEQTIYFDAELGAMHSYKENFKILIKTALGNTYEFSGFAESEISELKKVPQKTVEDAIKNLNLENTSVVQDERGLTITIENIQFLADSAILLAKEKEKLIKLAEILKDFPNNDLLISGHTALAGSEAARLKLSKERAQAVANFLVSIGLKDAYHVFTQGFGAEKPIAPNETEAGKAKNRRVEITILEN